MWEYRDRQAEAVAALGIPFKLDVCLPIAVIPAFLERLDALDAVRGMLPAAATSKDATSTADTTTTRFPKSPRKCESSPVADSISH